MSSIARSLDLPQWRYTSDRPRLGRILALVVVVHAALLLIPARRPPLPVPVRQVAISLQAPPLAAAVTLPEPDLQETAERREPLPALPPVAVPLPETPASAAPTEEELVPAPSPPLSTAYLLDQASEMEWQLEQAAERLLGVPAFPPLPWNLARPVLPLAANAFDDRFAPGEQEVIDQWMDPTGVINAVVRLPNGEVLCGRAQPWDPMDPLVEHVAMYRSCGSGGKRKSSLLTPFLSRD